jgi:hypothetical protein
VRHLAGVIECAEHLERHVQLAKRSKRARQAPRLLFELAAPRARGDERQRFAQPPSRHPRLVDRLDVALASRTKRPAQRAQPLPDEQLGGVCDPPRANGLAPTRRDSTVSS